MNDIKSSDITLVINNIHRFDGSLTNSQIATITRQVFDLTEDDLTNNAVAKRLRRLRENGVRVSEKDIDIRNWEMSVRRFETMTNPSMLLENRENFNLLFTGCLNDDDCTTGITYMIDAARLIYRFYESETYSLNFFLARDKDGEVRLFYIEFDDREAPFVKASQPESSMNGCTVLFFGFDKIDVDMWANETVKKLVHTLNDFSMQSYEQFFNLEPLSLICNVHIQTQMTPKGTFDHFISVDQMEDLEDFVSNVKRGAPKDFLDDLFEEMSNLEDVEVDEDEEPEKPNLDFQAIITPQTLVVVRNNEPISITRTHKNFDKIKDAIAAKDAQLVFDLIDYKNRIKQIILNDIKVDENGDMFVRGNKTETAIALKIKELLSDGDEQAIEKLVKFQDRLLQNPSFRTVDRLYTFISNSCIDIDEDGYLIAYKIVRNTYYDLYSNTFDNSPGRYVSMPRNEVNDDPDQTCAAGLHACASNYLRHYGGLGRENGRVIRVRIDPKDVVAIPADYDCRKMRTSGYKVLDDVTTEMRHKLNYDL